MNAQNVLLVDDQPLIRKSLRSILESIDENLIIIAASSLEEAIRYVHSGEQPLLTLLDLQLPDATGTVTLDTFRRKCPGLPIVAMIERADQAVTHACQVAGTLGLVLKNADTQPITDCLRTAIRLARNSNDPKSGSGSAPASHAAVVRPEFQDHLSIPKANAPQGLRVQPAVYPGSNTAPAQPHREYRDGRHLGLSERQRSVLRLMMVCQTRASAENWDWQKERSRSTSAASFASWASPRVRKSPWQPCARGSSSKTSQRPDSAEQIEGEQAKRGKRPTSKPDVGAMQRNRGRQGHRRRERASELRR